MPVRTRSTDEPTPVTTQPTITSGWSRAYAVADARALAPMIATVWAATGISGVGAATDACLSLVAVLATRDHPESRGDRRQAHRSMVVMGGQRYRALILSYRCSHWEKRHQRANV